MMEMLLATAGAGGDKFFPNSGPGSKTLLMGNEALGYFGDMGNDFEFTQKTLNLILPSHEVAILDLSGVQDNSWLKFIFNGKTLYTPRRPIAGFVSHADLYDSGMAFPYGKEIAYNYTEYPNTPQDAVIEVLEDGKPHVISARLMRAFSTDGDYLTAGTSFPATTTETAKNSEMYNLLFRLIGQVPNDGKEFPTIPVIQTAAYGTTSANNCNTLFSETTVGDRRAGVRYYNTFVSNYNTTDIFTKSGIYFFRPVLEYLPNASRLMSLKKTVVSNIVPKSVMPWCEVDNSTQPLEVVFTFMREQPDWQVAISADSPTIDIDFVAQSWREQPEWGMVPYGDGWTAPTDTSLSFDTLANSNGVVISPDKKSFSIGPNVGQEWWKAWSNTYRKPSVGKFYFEVELLKHITIGSNLAIGVAPAATGNGGNAGDAGRLQFFDDGRKRSGGAYEPYGAAFAPGDRIGVGISTAGLEFFVNGVSQGIAFPLNGGLEYEPHFCMYANVATDEVIIRSPATMLYMPADYRSWLA